MDRSILNPAQLRVVDELMATGQPRPVFRPELAPELMDCLEERLSPIAETLAPRELGWINKARLSQVHSCEAYYLNEALEGFPGWNARTARGTVVHKAVELSVSLGSEAPPLTLVDYAIESLRAEDRRGSPKPWLDE